LNGKRDEAIMECFANILAQFELSRLSKLHGGFNYRIPKPGAAITINPEKENTF